MTQWVRLARRWAFRVATAISLVLLIAAGVLWVRTYYVGYEYFDAKVIQTRRTTYIVFLDADMSMGEVFMVVALSPPLRAAPPPPPPPSSSMIYVQNTMVIQPGWRQQTPYPLDAYMGAWHGFLGSVHVFEPGDTSVRVLVPWWFIMVISAIMPAGLVISRRRRRKIPAGVCAMCGYNLTGNTSGVCPECGMSVSAGKTG
jgi:hypothetical protein